MSEHNPEIIAEQIEALLFTLGRPISRIELAKKLQVSEEEIAEALTICSSRGAGGITLVDDGVMVELRTSPSAAELVERVQKEEYSRDIGKAGLEALAAIVYRGPLTRAEVDFIRGVNSTQTLRTLTMRGLIRKVPNPKDERSFVYQPTTEVYAQLGVHSQSELPEYASTRAKLEQLEVAYRTKEDETHVS